MHRFIINYVLILYLEYIQADSAALVHIGVVDLCDEPQLGRLEGVALGQQDLQLEHAAAVRSVGRPQQHRLQRVRLVFHLQIYKVFRFEKKYLNRPGPASTGRRGEGTS